MNNDQLKKDVKILLDYLWHDEEKHYQENSYPRKHIFQIVKRLAKAIKYQPNQYGIASNQ